MNVAYNMDCMEAMKAMPDKCFDLAVIDPPYRDESENQPTRDMRRNGSMRSFGNKPGKEFFDELFRVSKEQIIWGANNFQLPPYKGFIVWKKKTISDVFTMSMAEIAYISGGGWERCQRFSSALHKGRLKIHESTPHKSQLPFTGGYSSTTPNLATRYWTHI